MALGRVGGARPPPQSGLAPNVRRQPQLNRPRLTHTLACAQQLKPELHSLPGQGLQAVPPACKEYTPCLSPLLSEHFGWAWFVSLEVWVRQP